MGDTLIVIRAAIVQRTFGLHPSVLLGWILGALLFYYEGLYPPLFHFIKRAKPSWELFKDRAALAAKR